MAMPFRSSGVIYVQGLHSACFSPKGDQVLTASHDVTARLWNLNGEFEGLQGTQRTHLPSPLLLCWRRWSQLLQMTLSIFDVPSGECQQEFTGHASAVYQAVFSPDDSQALTAGGHLRMAFRSQVG